MWDKVDVRCKLYVYVYDLPHLCIDLCYMFMFITCWLARLSWNLSFPLSNGITICNYWIIGRYFWTCNKICLIFYILLIFTGSEVVVGDRVMLCVMYLWNYYVMYFFVRMHPRFHCGFMCTTWFGIYILHAFLRIIFVILSLLYYCCIGWYLWGND